MSVLAKEIGVIEALTIEDSRQGGANSKDDSGAEIAELLGLTIFKSSREAYKRHGFEAEALFNFGGNPDDLPFYAFKDRLSDTLLFNGIHGDTVWNRVTPDRQWRRLDACGASMQEFRLRAGFIHAPLPFFGCDAHTSIIAISQSPQMAPWTLWNTYDRPIPRRIVEEAGIPRKLFGMEKKAVTTTFGIDSSDYIKAKDFHVSDTMRRKLADHVNANYSKILQLNIIINNMTHHVIYGMYKLFHLIKGQKAKNVTVPAKHQMANKSTLKSRYDKQSRFRWKYMKPFTGHCFSAQVANTYLTRDYINALNSRHTRIADNDIVSKQ